MSEISSGSTQELDHDQDKKCEVCHSADHAETMLLCDKCDRGFHTQCLGLASVPEDKWFCDPCIGKVDVPDNVKACSKQTKDDIRKSLQLVEGETPSEYARHCCWLCTAGPKQAKSRVEEFVHHLKLKHQDHELVPQILRYQKIYLLKKEAKSRVTAASVETRKLEAATHSSRGRKKKQDASTPKGHVSMSKEELEQLLTRAAEMGAVEALKKLQKELEQLVSRTAEMGAVEALQKLRKDEKLAWPSAANAAEEQQMSQVADTVSPDENQSDGSGADSIAEPVATEVVTKAVVAEPEAEDVC